MNIIISGKNIDLTPAIKKFVTDKLDSLAKLIKDKGEQLAEVRVEVGLPSKHHQSGKIYYAEANLAIGSKLFRANESHFDLNSAIVAVREELERQLRKDKDKELSKRRKAVKP